VPETIPALRSVLEEAPVGLLLLDRDGSVAWANATYRRWTGVADRTPARATYLDDPWLNDSVVGKTVGRTLSDTGAVGTVATIEAVPLPHAQDQGERYADVTLSVVPAAERRPSRLVLILVDASGRMRQQEQARLQYEAFLSSSNAIEVTDRNGVLVDVNPAFEATYGYSRAECLGKKPNLVRSRQTSPEVYARMWADLTAPDRGHWSGEIINRDRWGRERPVFLTVTAVRNPVGETTHYVGVAVDLTEHKTWERVAAHSDRLASLGQLAAGVAHEINTPLANVMLVAESLRRRAADPWTRGRAETITAQVEIAARIVRGLLDFARRSDPHVVRLDLADVAQEAVRFLRGKQSPTVEIAERYPPEPLPILGDRGQLMQVFTNLLLNAYDALEGAAEGRIVVEVRRTGPNVEVEVCDSGPGIPLEALPHVFEPFFTTKPEGRGTGLGLAICHGIVQAHGGSIVARNLREGGASLLVSLPLAPPPETPSAL
jgi:PAS domain S-box-containing protein